jgi:hypothetical protein
MILKELLKDLLKQVSRLEAAREKVREVETGFMVGESAWESGKKLVRATRHEAKVRRGILGSLTSAKNLVSGKAKTPCPLCPLCRVPIKGWSALARHLHRKHGFRRYLSDNLPAMTTQCPCGHKEPATKKGFAHFGSHLRGQKDLKTHLNLNRVLNRVAGGVP